MWRKIILKPVVRLTAGAGEGEALVLESSHLPTTNSRIAKRIRLTTINNRPTFSWMLVSGRILDSFSKRDCKSSDKRIIRKLTRTRFWYLFCTLASYGQLGKRRNSRCIGARNDITTFHGNNSEKCIHQLIKF